MWSKVLISCALFVAVQANYGLGHGHNNGYSAALVPRAVIHALPHGHGHAGGLGGLGGLGGYGGGHGGGHGSHIGPAVIAAAKAQPSVAGLTKLGLSLPSPRRPIPAVINVPQYSITAYSSPAVHVASHGHHGGVAY